MAVAAVHDVIPLADEPCHLLPHMVILHLAISGIPEVAPDEAPLVVVLLHILPIYPCVGSDVTDIVNQPLCQSEVSVYAFPACTRLAHPYLFAFRTGKRTEPAPVTVVGGIGV